MDNTNTKEKVVLIPKSKSEKSTRILIERQEIDVIDGINENVHVGGGDHTGILIQKHLSNEKVSNYGPCQASLEFKVFLVNSKTQKHTLESRILRYWFKEYFNENDYGKSAQEFFKLLVSPTDFPRDYVGFITKVLKLLQNGHNHEIKCIEMELNQLEELQSAPERPSNPHAVLISLTQSRKVSADDGHVGGQKIQLNETKLLEMIESAYPNPLTLQDILATTLNDAEEIQSYLNILQEKGLIKTMENNAFTRVVQNQRNVKIVNQMPQIAKKKQPSIAIITAQYCEKVAVDAMIEDQETFVRYTTVGESNVYTLGNIGSHRVVSTKLPSVGHTREAMIAAGSTTTRLLGTFQKVDYVFLVGVGGGVPHYTDYSKHVRLGDVVISAPTTTGRPVYVYCEKPIVRSDGTLHFETKGWAPSSDILQEIGKKVVTDGLEDWEYQYEIGYKKLKEQDADFSRPPPTSDKLYMAIGEREVIEVAHPTPSQSDKNISTQLECRVHFGTVASGRQIARDDHARQEMASRNAILAFDSEFDSVLESVIGNCRDAFIVIRGISDYKDGTRRRDWQPHAALLAASFAKTLIMRMNPPPDC